MFLIHTPLDSWKSRKTIWWWRLFRPPVENNKHHKSPSIFPSHFSARAALFIERADSRSMWCFRRVAHLLVGGMSGWSPRFELYSRINNNIKRTPSSPPFVSRCLNYARSSFLFRLCSSIALRYPVDWRLNDASPRPTLSLFRIPCSVIMMGL